MSEFLNVNLLGIIGTVTGIIALAISYRTYSKQKPNLNVKVTNCEYGISFDSAFHHRAINLWAKFQIKNIGDRGTSINDIVLSFTVDGKKYQFNKKYFGSPRIALVPEGLEHLVEMSKSEWIEAHQTRDIEANFIEQFDGTEENQIDCIFTIYDTHRGYRVKAISKNTRKPLI
jgi:hypothetical protein